MKPMQPIQRMESIATTTKRLVSGAHSSVGTMVASRMMRPPIVGVPRLLWWLAGPSARMTCPTFRARSRRITGGPDDEGEQQRRHRRARRSEADVVEEIENDVRLAERREPMIEHPTSAE